MKSWRGILHTGEEHAVSSQDLVRVNMTAVLLILPALALFPASFFGLPVYPLPALLAAAGIGLLALYLNSMGFFTAARHAVIAGALCLQIFTTIGAASHALIMVTLLLPFYLSFTGRNRLLVMTVLLSAVAAPALLRDHSEQNIRNLAALIISPLALALILRQSWIIRTTSTETGDRKKDHKQDLGRIISRIRKFGGDLNRLHVPLSQNSRTLHDFTDRQISSLTEVRDLAATIRQSTEQVSGTARDEIDRINTLVNEANQVLVRSEETRTNFIEAANLVEKSTSLGKSGETSLMSMIEGMGYMIDTTEEMKKVAGIINDIADRINLLSLNASIEAARAGKAGQGFAVVAGEISSLAGQTAQSTTNINFLTETASQIITNYRNELRENAKNLRLLIDSINQANDLFTSVIDTSARDMRLLQDVQSNVQKIGGIFLNIDKLSQEQKKVIVEVISTLSAMRENGENYSFLSETLSNAAGEISLNISHLEKSAGMLEHSLSRMET